MNNINSEMGYIRFTSFNNAREKLKEIDSEFDIKIHITLHQNKGILPEFIHVPQLAPSKELFNITMYKWKKLKFTKEEILIMNKGKTGTWVDLYEPKFKDEMSSRIEFKKSYNRIKEHLKNGKKIIAVCYCEDENKCHRKIISNSIKLEGFNSELI